LPDDVFEPGDIRPTRPKKKIVKKTEATAQKRNIDSLEVSPRYKGYGIYHMSTVVICLFNT